MNTTLRTLSALGLLTAALAASAQQTAYTSLGYAGNPGGVGDLLINGPYSLFASGLTSTLTGFQVLVLNSDTAPVSFNVRLYADVPPTATGGTDTVGTQIAAFTGTMPSGSSPSVVSVAASGVPLVAGTKYWLGLDGGTLDSSGFGNQAWFHATTGAPTTTTRVFNTYAANAAPYGLTVLVAVQPTPEPSALAALGLGALAFVKRRKRA